MYHLSNERSLFKFEKACKKIPRPNRIDNVVLPMQCDAIKFSGRVADEQTCLLDNNHKLKATSWINFISCLLATDTN